MSSSQLTHIFWRGWGQPPAIDRLRFAEFRFEEEPSEALHLRTVEVTTATSVLYGSTWGEQEMTGVTRKLCLRKEHAEMT